MPDPAGRADIWLAQESNEPEIVVVGVPWAAESTGIALAPMALRDRLIRFSTYHLEREVDFSDKPVRDEGNWPVSRMSEDELLADIPERLGALPQAALTVFIGGDGVITRALASDPEGGSRSGLIRFSSRPRPDVLGPGLSGRQTVLVGAHSFSASMEEKTESDRAGVSIISSTQIAKEGIRMTIDRSLGALSMCEKIHMSIDLDVLDRSHAPAAPSAIPGGMTARELSEAVRRCARNGKVRSVDLVGVDAEADSEGLTVDAMCHALLSVFAGYAERH